MSQPIGPLAPDSPRAEFAGPRIDDDHRVAFIRSTDVTRTWNRVSHDVRMKRADDLAAEGLRGVPDLLPVSGVDPETTCAAAPIPSFNKSHNATVFDERAADFAKLLGQLSRAGDDLADALRIDQQDALRPVQLTILPFSGGRSRVRCKLRVSQQHRCTRL